MNKKNIIILIAFIILGLTFIYLGIESQIGEPVPCVDGNQEMNLEGFMCENTFDTWYGLNNLWCLAFILAWLFGACWLVLRCFEE